MHLEDKTKNGNIMKRTKKKWLQGVNRLLAGVLALMGFNACDKEPLLAYGCPYGTYEAKGKVVNTEETPLQGIRVITKPMQQEHGTGKMRVLHFHHFDTLQTNAQGIYQLEKREYEGASHLRIVCEDPNDAYQTDSTDVELNYEGGDGGWKIGKAQAEADFTLKERTEEEE